jgi:3-dehydroquinate dehydratase/shikimate dehydrogenase
VKIANTAQDITDVRRIMTLIETQSVHGPVIGLSMGERGQMTRILAPKFGSFLTFGALSQGKESAPGQPTLAALAELYRLGEQTPSTPVLGVIGNPVGHSRSPALHNRYAIWLRRVFYIGF